MKLTFLGDVHGNFKKLEDELKSINSEFIFQCGDLGVFPKFHNMIGIIPNREYKFKLKSEKRIYFCPGNYEDWDYLDSLSCCEIFDNVYYMKKGSVLSIDNINILFMGGAESVDKKQRIFGCDYFKQELITYKDILELPDIPIDIVVSHTCPLKVFPIINNKMKRHNIDDPCRHALDDVYEKYKPKYWFFGHFHNSLKFKFEGCHFQMLNLIGRVGWKTTINISD